MRRVTVCVFLAGTAATVFAQAPVLNRVIDAPVPIEIPADNTGGRDIIKSRFRIVSRIARFPAGFEEAVEPQEEGKARAPVDLRGMTVRQALDALVAADPRYEWRTMSGVTVMRPISEWGDCRHFLHREVSFERDGLTVASATRAFQHLIDPTFRERPSREMPGSPATPFSVEVPRGTLLEVFNAAAVRGRLSWSISYGEAQSERRWIEVALQQLDGPSVGWGAVLRPVPADCP